MSLAQAPPLAPTKSQQRKLNKAIWLSRLSSTCTLQNPGCSAAICLPSTLPTRSTSIDAPQSLDCTLPSPPTSPTECQPTSWTPTLHKTHSSATLFIRPSDSPPALKANTTTTTNSNHRNNNNNGINIIISRHSARSASLQPGTLSRRQLAKRNRQLQADWQQNWFTTWQQQQPQPQQQQQQQQHQQPQQPHRCRQHDGHHEHHEHRQWLQQHQHQHQYQFKQHQQQHQQQQQLKQLKQQQHQQQQQQQAQLLHNHQPQPLQHQQHQQQPSTSATTTTIIAAGTTTTAASTTKTTATTTTSSSSSSSSFSAASSSAASTLNSVSIAGGLPLTLSPHMPLCRPQPMDRHPNPTVEHWHPQPYPLCRPSTRVERPLRLLQVRPY